MATLQELIHCIRPFRPVHRPASFLRPCITARPQLRCASILSELSDPASAKKPIRRGRGASSGKGKTAGRGHKGQGQRGKVPHGFEGGQTPLYILKGKRGFENIHALDMAPVNLDRVQSWIDQGRLDPSKTITVKELAESRCIHGVKDGVKLLAKGATALRTPINILVSRASAAAIAAVEGAGGSIMTRYYTAASIRRILRGESDANTPLPNTFPALATTTTTTTTSSSGNSSQKKRKPETTFRYRVPDPSSRKDIEYYRDPAHRGYLSHLVPAGEGPSLFFKVPKEGGARTEASAGSDAGGADGADGAGSRRKKDSALGAENRIW